MKKVAFVAIIMLLLWAGAYFFNQRTPRLSDETKTTKAQQVEVLPQVNFEAPNFTAIGLDSKSYSLSEFKGKPIIVNFWASWCGPCKLEASELSSIYDKYKGKVVVLGVNLTDTENSLSDVQAFATYYHFKFPALLDRNGNISKKYRIKPIPDTFFINENGIIEDKILGYGGEGALTKKAKKLIASSGGGNSE